MESASFPTSQAEVTSPLMQESYVTSVEIELKPVSSKYKKKNSVKPLLGDIELGPVSKPHSTSPPPSPSTTTKQQQQQQSPSAKTSVSFAAEPSKTANTSFTEDELSYLSSSPFLTSSRSKERKRWNAVEEADQRKGFRVTLKRMMGCGSSLDAMYDDPMPVVVFGATGLVGGAVARALLRDRRFEVKAVTRSPTTDVARKLAEEGAIIVTADLNDPRSLTRALEGAHAVFLVTHYWEHMNKEKEITQGKNCVDAAVSAGVAHFVFYGSESPKEVSGTECGYMDAKAAIEKHVTNTKLPYTALRFPFYFENFLGVFKPHRVKNGVFAIALPMEDKAMDCISVQDVGRCVLNVLLRPKNHLCRVLPLTAEKLTVQQITDTFNKHFTDRKFICPRIGVKDYEQFGFDGAKDIAAMFLFYQSGQESRDAKLTRRVQGAHTSFDRWVAENKQKLTDSMNMTE